MLKTTPQSLVQFNPLDDPPEFDLLDLPSKWTGEWVSRRFVNGLKTLRLIPMRAAPRGFTSALPAYAYEFEDLIGQAEQREALEQTQREQNRVRLQPSYRQVTVCEAVISWPLYLTDRVAFSWAYACERDATFVASRHGGCASGLRSIARRSDPGVLVTAPILRRAASEQ